jgi:hypothetical protein
MDVPDAPKKDGKPEEMTEEKDLIKVCLDSKFEETVKTPETTVTPPTETPPTETSVETPPTETSVETPPVETPPVETKNSKSSKKVNKKKKPIETF